MDNPISTYRIQFRKGFTFKDLAKNIPYLKELGIQTIYASPIFEAVLNSTHGYDIVNPHQINPVIGTEEELFALVAKLKQAGISWLQDIVPNHMAFHPANAWLMDVLEKWDQSVYLNFFDLNFLTNLKDNRLMVPFLGQSLYETIKQDELKVILKEDKLYFNYFEYNWPLNFKSYALVFPSASFTTMAKFRLLLKDSTKHRALKNSISTINEHTGKLLEIADAQYYRLCHWQETETQINYRRFFTVNSLICMNMQHQEVFDTYHQYILSLVEKGIFKGLRIDHIDGLYDPKAYLDRLRYAVGDDVYIVVEKILGATEEMPSNWAVQGNTGYDFLATVNNLFTNRNAEKSFNKLYKKVIQKPIKADGQVIIKKTEILYGHMQGELDYLYELFVGLGLVNQKQISSLKEGSLKEAIANLLIYCPVYRFYGNAFPLTVNEHKALQKLFLQFPKTEDSLPAINLLTSALIDQQFKSNTAKRQKALYFYQRWMQFSGPLMAKGVEDTLMYTYNRFVGHTEVGDAPAAFGLSIPAFHKKMVNRLQQPLSMNATSTHDTKRGEDIRARLNVLTDLPKSWGKLVLKLQQNSLTYANPAFNLHQNDAYFIYQTLLGVLPLVAQGGDEIKNRLGLYVEKALREAKKRSGWAQPDEDYEIAVKNFTVDLLDQTQNNYIILSRFLSRIADYSIINSLAQLLLKCTCPGIPDIYQGTELWDLSLVDPDNRRPVDYKVRNKWIKEIKADDDLRKLWEERFSGKIKLWLTRLLLKVRLANQQLFDKGTYLPLKVKGHYKKHILAYLRHYENSYVLVAIPLGLAKIADQQEGIKDFDWKDTRVLWSSVIPNQRTNLLTKNNMQKASLADGVLISELFDQLPIALFDLKL